MRRDVLGADISINGPGVSYYHQHRKHWYCSAVCVRVKELHVFEAPGITITIAPIRKWNEEQQRYHQNIEDLLLPIMHVLEGRQYDVIHESVSYGSAGRVAQLGFILQTFNSILYNNIDAPQSFTAIAPASVKKQSSGNGRADKEDMHSALVKAGYDIMKITESKWKITDSPVSDIVDSMLIAMIKIKENENV